MRNAILSSILGAKSTSPHATVYLSKLYQFPSNSLPAFPRDRISRFSAILARPTAPSWHLPRDHNPAMIFSTKETENLDTPSKSRLLSAPRMSQGTRSSAG